MGFHKLLPLLLLVAQCVNGFYPMEYLDLLRLSGRAGLDSEEFYSKDETSRHDETTKEDYLPAETRHRDDYSNSHSDYHRDYDSSEDYETQTFSSLFEKPPAQENDALYSPPKVDRYHKREEYFGELSKKSTSSFSKPRKVSLHSPEDLLSIATGPIFNQPLSRPVGRSRRARLSDYDLYYPKRRHPSDSSPDYRSKSLPSSKPYDEYSSDVPKREYHEDSSPVYKSKSLSSSKSYDGYSSDVPKRPYSEDSKPEYKPKPLLSSKPYDSYSIDVPKRPYSEDSKPEYKPKSLLSSKPYDSYSSDYFPRHVDEPERSAYPLESYTRAPYHEPHSKPLPKPARKTYPRSSAPIKSKPRDLPPISTYSRQKSKDASSSVVSRPLKFEREISKKYPPRKFSESQARAPYYDDDDEDEDFRGKPLVTTTSWNKEKRQPKHISEEKKHYLAATGYGKPMREQFHEQGTTGPHAYKFGYNTGDPENPMARYEERGPDGLVKGSYSYVDPTGKLQVVHYESHPEHGFKTTYA